MIRVVMFDFDGTIVNSARVVFNLFNGFANKYNYDQVPEEEVELFRSLTMKERFKRYNVSKHIIPSLTMDIVKKYKESIPDLQPIDGIKEVIQELKGSRLRLVLISANSKHNIGNFLQLNDLDCFGDILKANRFFGRHNTINKYLKKEKIDKDTVMYVGDEHRDIIACQKSGVKNISVTWGYDTEELLQQANPDYIVHQPSQILEIVRG